MALGLRFVLTGAKRVVDSRAMYAQVVVTDDCNLTCSYCDEYAPGAPKIPLPELKRRIDKLDELGVQVYDFLGGEPLMHPDIAELIRYVKSKRGGSNLATIITNAFLLGEKGIHDLNDAGPIALANRIYDPVTEEEIRAGLLYDKGALLLAALHKEVGDEVFFTFLKSYQKSFAWKFGTTKHLAGLLQFLTKKDYTPFFEKYYWGTEMPPP